MIDIGCGGGILSESLAGLGARVTAIDPSETSIQCANYHMEKYRPDLEKRLEYIQTAVEDLDPSFKGNFYKIISNSLFIYFLDYEKIL